MSAIHVINYAADGEPKAVCGLSPWDAVRYGDFFLAPGEDPDELFPALEWIGRPKCRTCYPAETAARAGGAMVLREAR